MECEELYDAPKNPQLSKQKILLEDFGNYESKFKPYVGMQFDFLDSVETFYKDLESVSTPIKDHL